MNKLPILLLMCFTNTLFAATTRTWDNGNGNQLWTDAVNWSSNLTPTIIDNANIRMQAGPIINNPMAAKALQILIGGEAPGDTAYMTMNGGTLDVNDTLQVGYNLNTRGTGVFNMNGGTITTVNLWVNSKLAGTTSTLNMTNGTINVSGTFGISEYSGVTGIVNLNGGSINTAAFRMNNAGGTAGRLNISNNGMLIINSNMDATIGTYISNGWITAGGGTIQHDYGVTNSGKTTVYIALDRSRNPNPANGISDVSRNPVLSWTAGAGATSHDIYFGTASPGILQGNQSQTTFDPGQLAPSTTYFWRVDEINGSNTIVGDVWSFTTDSGRAKNPDPPNAASNTALNKILSWTAGSGASSHDVYFGTSINDVNTAARLPGDLNGSGIADWDDLSMLCEYWLADPTGTEPFAAINGDSIVDFMDYALFSREWSSIADAAFQGNRDANSFAPGTLGPDETYYWRVDEVNGPDTIKGSVWSFSTPMAKATNPIPVNAAGNAGTSAALSWTAGAEATSHNVYFGTSNPPALQGNQTGTTYIPTLAASTTYYWRIDEINAGGTTTGDAWSFTTGPGMYTFVQASDPQIGWTQCGNKDYLWGTTIGKINNINPAFVIVTGDLITSNSDMGMTATYKSYAANINPWIPIYTLPGNHDISEPSNITKYNWWLANLAYPTGIANPWYSFTYGNDIFICLETGVLRSPGGTGLVGKDTEQMSWLTNTLRDANAAGYAHKFVFTHIPLCLSSVDEPENTSGFNLPIPLRQQLLSLFHQYKVTAVFSGHKHTNAYVKDGDLELITTSSCTCGLGGTPFPPGIRIINVYADHIEQEYLELTSLP